MPIARDRDRDRDREMMGFYITLCAVHTTQGQGQGQGPGQGQETIGLHTHFPVPCTGPCPGQCERAITATKQANICDINYSFKRGQIAVIFLQKLKY